MPHREVRPGGQVQFGPLGTHACGENYYIVKTLGLLALRPDLRRRFVEHVFKDCAPLGDSTDIRIQSKGEELLRHRVENGANFARQLG